LEELKAVNNILYADILPENYEISYANPDFAVKKLGEYGRFFSAVYAELRSQIAYAYEADYELYVANLELFLELYSIWNEAYNEIIHKNGDGDTHIDEKTDASLPKLKYMKEAYYYHMYDYADISVAGRTLELIDSGANTFARDIVVNSNLDDIRYLYRYGEYIGENEIKTAEFMNKLPEDDVRSMAAIYVNGFIEGFKTMRIDIKPKKTVNIRYAIGQERMIREAVKLFRENGLEPVILRYAVSRVNRKLNIRTGYTATPANKQYEYDHRMDEALFFDKAFTERKLEIIEDVYEKHKDMAAAFAGPAVIETFGEVPFVPVAKDTALALDEKQKELSVSFGQKSAELSNRYMPRDKYSFTIIAYPLPEIGDKFEEIFEETVRVNTLDNELYKKIQQNIIDELDNAEYVHVIGQNENKTDIKVMLHKIDRTRETNFENCVADVNIPVGEVFTSPVLTGTNGILNVSSAYLNELKYSNLTIEFENGRMKRYLCNNFEDEEKNISFIKENLMFNHDTLPIGEFAIGTNTTAYVMGRKYDIIEKLPILIVEKTGPHFAVGDTCYSYSEDARLYNPDGREIVAKDNECSMLRNSPDNGEREKAYFNCHTDITIPYEEIGGIYSVHADGKKVAIIENGRFVLKGTEKLNEALDEIYTEE
jgi:leucyl aminopeptidase (aminopeptidase T)